ncbi:T9SS type A sorting domain-containing protein [Aureibacter tunicatorum]|uniref:Secretion system C-terminal sorting domain-containing protein n=1 Tax=Aureibacter tunicatorum TaxID=866807 RepID=A0AAE3XMR4_9BACT|nr:T9SS type A sorting domain-containing protein [Aureibacter tunicatorum]MDR6239345.1 hypothetical protein [Aureibacter tunicatorum]BDD04732.1 hypothetical protein AUTU_22150 [Aureibacter tunicatorum]
MGRDRYIAILFFLFASATWIEVNAQVEIIPLNKTKKHQSSRRLSEDPNLKTPFPFWDDFSKANIGPDQNKWLYGPLTTSIRSDKGIDNPSYQVAMLSALNNDGSTVSSDPYSKGVTDSLVSHTIDWSYLNESNKDNVFLSFFWQAPMDYSFRPTTEDDSLVLQFMNADSIWSTVWSIKGEDIIEENFTKFTQESIKVSPEMQSERFRFAFKSYGLQSGEFAVWLLDYILLTNHESNQANTAYEDRTLVDKHTRLFDSYTEIPLNALQNQTLSNNFRPHTRMYNMNDIGQPIQYYMHVKNKATGEIIQTLATPDDVDENIGPKSFALIQAAEPFEIENIDTSMDSINLELVTELATGDTYLKDHSGGFYENVDLRLNDTLRTTFKLAEHYAYDDGESEISIRTLQQGSVICQEFVTLMPDTLTHIHINLPSIDRFRPETGVPFDIVIYKKIKTDDNSSNELIHLENVVSRASSDYENFIEYKLSKRILVEDTVYIGWKISSSAIAVGMDLNNSVSDPVEFDQEGKEIIKGKTQKIYELQTGTTFTKFDKAQGSLLLRPVFKKNEIISGIEDIDLNVKVYPNPNSGEFTVESLSTINSISIHDISGNIVYQQDSSIKNIQQINISFLPSGIYIVKVLTAKGYAVKKIIIR